MTWGIAAYYCQRVSLSGKKLMSTRPQMVNLSIGYTPAGKGAKPRKFHQKGQALCEIYNLHKIRKIILPSSREESYFCSTYL